MQRCLDRNLSGKAWLQGLVWEEVLVDPLAEIADSKVGFPLHHRILLNELGCLLV